MPNITCCYYNLVSKCVCVWGGGGGGGGGAPSPIGVGILTCFILWETPSCVFRGRIIMGPELTDGLERGEGRGGECIKTESARTSSSCWTKLCTKIIYTLLQAFVLLL